MIDQELIELVRSLNNIPILIERALIDALVLRHPGHVNQKTHGDRKSTRLNSSHIQKSRMPSSA